MNPAPEELPPVLPSAKPIPVSDTITVHPPLSRLGTGPGLLLLLPHEVDLEGSAKTLDPPPLKKWAEEGYAVAQIVSSNSKATDLEIADALAALSSLSGCSQSDRVGLISYNVSVTTELCNAIDKVDQIVAVITYGSTGIKTAKSQLRHVPVAASASLSKDVQNINTFFYPSTGPFFTIPSHTDFRAAPASVAHTRNLSFLKPFVGGPYFDLEAIWEEHTRFEFEERAVERTMSTMVEEPYVNHIPTMTGGLGRDRLTNFYRHHFIFSNPPDTALELVSRTVGVDRVIDEFVFSFTHDRMIDWILPGVPPTGKHCVVPFTSIVCIRGDRLYHEHISWDGATLLRQLGLLPEYLPFPYALPDGSVAGKGKRIEYRVPTAGVEIAKKLVDESSVASNGLFQFDIREVDV